MMRFSFLTSLFLFIISHPLINGPSDEQSLTAAYLERVTRFIENKKYTEFDSRSEYFKILVVGKNDYQRVFDEIFSNQTIRNRKVELSYSYSFQEYATNKPNMIFVTKGFTGDVEQIVKYANRNGILTIAEKIGVGKQGIHINLYKESQRLKIEINLKSANDAGFSISHLLLKNARLVE
jgi:hypothetical protein